MKKFASQSPKKGARVLAISHSAVVKGYRRRFQVLANMGWEIHLVLPPAWPEGGQWVKAPAAGEEKGVHLYSWDARWIGRIGGYHFLKWRDRVAEIRPSLFFVDEEPYSWACWQAMRSSLKLGRPLVFFSWENIFRKYKPPLCWMDRFNLARGQWALAAGPGALQVLRQRGFRGEIVPAVPYGVDVEHFSPGPGSGNQNFRIGYYGRLLEEKGLRTLLAAFARLEFPARLRIMGQGGFRPQLEKEIVRLGLAGRVELLDPVPQENMPERLRELDALVLPSETRRAWKEQFGRILVEAMACGIPVVGSTSGEIPNVIGAAGLIFPEGEAEALAGVLRRLRDEPELGAALSALGRRRAVADFSVERVAQSLDRVWTRMLAGGGK